MERLAQKSGPALAAALLSLFLYAVTIGGTYIYDDVQIIGNDERIHSPENWKGIWTKDYFNGAIDNLYRPLTTQSYAIQWWLLGNRPWAFHLVNVLLNAGAAAAVAEFARRLAGLRVAYIAGLLFAAHPIHVEAVAGIVGRAEELCTLFTLSALILFLHRPLTSARACAIGLCAIGAMLSKEQGMLLPFLVLALAWLIRYRPTSQSERKATMHLILWLTWTVAALIVIREELLNLRFEWDKSFLDISIQPMARSGAMDRFLMVFVILGRYTQLMAVPVKMSIDYGLSVMSSVVDRHDAYLYVGIITAIVLIASLLISLKKGNWTAAFCLIAAGLTYSMASNVILIGTIFAERLMYLPSAFLLIRVAMGLTKVPRKILAPAVAVVVILGSLRTVTYAIRWNDRYQFYVTSLAEQPKSVRLHELVATELIARNDLQGAAKVAADTIEIAPDYWNAWTLAGAIAEKQGNLEEAERMYDKAFHLSPGLTTKAMLARVQGELLKRGKK